MGISQATISGTSSAELRKPRKPWPRDGADEGHSRPQSHDPSDLQPALRQGSVGTSYMIPYNVLIHVYLAYTSVYLSFLSYFEYLGYLSYFELLEMLGLLGLLEFLELLGLTWAT